MIFLFKLSKDLIIIKKVKFSKPTLSDLTLLIIVIYVFLILGHFSNKVAAFF